MSAQDARQACTACGKVFECGMGGSDRCWCSTAFPAVMPLPESAKGCYCPECLADLIAAAQRQRSAT